jgi:murein DD-endopeptidase MepM/ murein hydrolase activator NlpD
MTTINGIAKKMTALYLLALSLFLLSMWPTAGDQQSSQVNEVQQTSPRNEAGWSRLGMPFKYLLLSVREPDEQLLMPVRGVRVKAIANTWHAPRDGGREHAGQDIFARRGTPVYSATGGYVWRVSESLRGGKTVSILGAGGRSYYYAHLDKHAEGLTEGAEVTTETLLGYVGTTGNAKGTPPHLHFSVYTATGAINPLPMLADRG